MPIIEGELQTFTENIQRCADLANFSCGDKRHSYEDTVERIIALHHGRCPSADTTLRVTREMPAGTLVGLSIILWKHGPRIRHRWLPEDLYADAAYIDILALSENYRGEGGYKCRDGTPVSDFVLAETLRHIEEHEGRMPVVQGVVEADNDDCRDLLARHKFEQPFVPAGDLLYVRLPEDEDERPVRAGISPAAPRAELTQTSTGEPEGDIPAVSD
jgi:hypothetical protein